MATGNGAVNLGLPSNTGTAVTPFSVSATSVASSSYDGLVFLPSLAVDAGDLALTLPRLAVDGQGMAGSAPGVGNVTLPALAVDAGDIRLVLPAPTLAAIGHNGANGTADLALPFPTLSGGLDGPLLLPAFTLAAAAAVGAVGAATLTLPPFGLSAEQGAVGAAQLPQWLVDASALSGNTGAGGTTGLVLPAPSVAAQGWGEGAGTADVVLSMWVVAGEASGATVSGGAVSFGVVEFSAAGLSGAVGTAQLVVPAFTLSATGYAHGQGAAVITLPRLAVSALAVSSARAAEDYVGVVLNTTTGAATTYTNMPFNSMTWFNGVVLAAGPDGIIALTGDTDRGDAVEAALAGGIADFGSAQFKRVTTAYVGYRADGDLELTLTADEHHTYSYRLLPRQLDALHASRVKLGRGVDGRYWQWRVDNIDGAQFALDELALVVEPTSRRV